MQIELSDPERDLVMRILDHSLADLRVEVRRTSTPKFHDDLQVEKMTLKGVLEKLRAA